MILHENLLELRMLSEFLERSVQEFARIIDWAVLQQAFNMVQSSFRFPDVLRKFQVAQVVKPDQLHKLFQYGQNLFWQRQILSQGPYHFLAWFSDLFFELRNRKL